MNVQKMYSTCIQHSILQIFWPCYGMYIWVQNSNLILTIKEESSNSCFIEHMFVCVLHWMIVCCLRAIAPYPFFFVNKGLKIIPHPSDIHYITSIFHKPKCQSGWTFVCPASTLLNSTLLCRPVSILHMSCLKEP